MKNNENFKSFKELYGRAGESLLNSFFELSNDGLCISDSFGQIKAHNQLFGLMIGKPGAEIDGTAFSAHFIPEDNSEGEHTSSSLLEKSLSGSCRVRLTTADGLYRMAEISSMEIEGELGTKDLLHVVKYVSSKSGLISEDAHVPRESSLGDFGKRGLDFNFQNIFSKGTSLPAQVYSHNGNVLFWNSGSEVLYGCSAKDIQGSSISGINLPAAKSEAVLNALRLMEAGRDDIPPQEFSLKLEGRGAVSVYSNFTVLHLNDGTAQLFCMDVDLCRGFTYDQDSILLQKRFKALIENSSDAVAILQPDGVASYVSPSVEHILGYSTAEALKLNLFDLAHPDDVPHMIEVYTALLSAPGKTIKPPINRIRHKNGRWVWIEGTLTNMLHDPDIAGIVDNFRDVSESYEVNSRLHVTLDVLNKRMQEQESLYFISRLNEMELSDEDLISRVCDEIMKSFEKLQSPEITVVHSKVGGNTDAVFTKDYIKSALDGSLDCIVGLEMTSHSADDDDLGFTQEDFNFLQAATDMLNLKLSRKHSQTEKDKNLQFLNDVMQQSLDVICAIDAEGKFISVSAAAKQTWGYDPDELLGKIFLSFLVEADVKPSFEIVERVIAGERITNFENHYVRKDGSIAPMFWSARWDESEQIMHCVGRDATEIINAEKELKHKARLLKESQSLARMGSWDFDVSTDQLTWSDAMHEVFDVNREEFKETHGSFLSLVVPEDQERVRLTSAHTQATGEPFNVEYRIVTPKGEKRVIEEFGYSEKDEKGKVVRLFGTAQDITQIRRAEYEIKLLIDNTEESFVLLDKNLDIVTFNQQFSSAYNKYLNKEVQRGQSILDYAQPERRAAVEDIYQRVLKGERESFELTMPTKDGKSFTSLIRYKPALDQWGEIIGAFVTIVDITEKKQAEDQLKMSERRFKALVQQGADLTTIVDKQGVVIYISPNHAAILGHSAEEMYKLDLNALVHDADRVEVARFFQSAQGSDRGVSSPYRFRHKDGRWRWLQSTVTDLSHDEAVGGLVIHTVDITQREDIAEKLRLSNERYHMVTKATSDAIWDYDLLTNSLYWGEGFQVLFGHTYTEQDKGYEKWASNLHPKEVSGINGFIQEKLGSEILNWQQEYRFKRADGSYAHVRDSAIAVRDEQGKALRLIGAMQDITKEHQEKIRIELSVKISSAFRSSNSLRDAIQLSLKPLLAIEHVQVAEIWLKAKNQEKIELFEHLTGNIELDKFYKATAEKLVYSLGEGLPGKAWEENALIYWDKHSDHRNFLRSEQAITAGLESAIAVPLSEGENITGVLFLGLSGEDFVKMTYIKLMKLIAPHFAAEIERKITTEALKISNERFEKVSEATNDGIWDWNLKDNTLYWGEGFRTLFGHKVQREEFSIKSWENFIHPDDKHRVLKDIYASIENRGLDSWHASYRFRKSDNSYAHISDRGIVVRNSRGEAVRMVGAMTDISERVEYEASLRKLNHTLKQKTADLSRSNAELEQFAYIASHDLQEPLRMITSFLAQLEKHYGHLFDEKAKRYIFFAVDGAKRMRQIILDLLEFSRVGRSDSKLEAVDLNEVMYSLTSIFKKRIVETNASIEYPEMPTLRTNRSAIRSIFQNLLDNALKYHKEEEPPRIKVSFELHEKGCEFCFQDEGIGMSKDYFDKIFIIFQRLHTADAYPGTGMGLAVTKKTVDYLNGKVWVESEEGKGSKFFVFLPNL